MATDIMTRKLEAMSAYNEWPASKRACKESTGPHATQLRLPTSILALLNPENDGCKQGPPAVSSKKDETVLGGGKPLVGSGTSSVDYNSETEQFLSASSALSSLSAASVNELEHLRNLRNNFHLLPGPSTSPPLLPPFSYSTSFSLPPYSRFVDRSGTPTADVSSLRHSTPRDSPSSPLTDSYEANSPTSSSQFSGGFISFDINEIDEKVAKRRKRNHWSIEEDVLLTELVKTYGLRNWVTIANIMKKKIPNCNKDHCQCSQHWRRVLSPRLEKSPNTPKTQSDDSE